MVKKIQFTIPGRIPSKKNSHQIFKAGHKRWVNPSKDYTQWEINSKFFLPDTQVDNVKKIIIIIYAPNKKKADLTNKVESIMDLMVRGQIIKDDNWFIIPKLQLIFGGVDKNNPRAEITILS